MGVPGIAQSSRALYTAYKNIDDQRFHFSQQLDKLAASGFIELTFYKGDSVAAAGTTHRANLTGSFALWHL